MTHVNGYIVSGPVGGGKYQIAEHNGTCITRVIGTRPTREEAADYAATLPAFAGPIVSAPAPSPFDGDQYASLMRRTYARHRRQNDAWYPVVVAGSAIDEVIYQDTASMDGRIGFVALIAEGHDIPAGWDAIADPGRAHEVQDWVFQKCGGLDD
jgi:hypothetical protein